MDNKTTQAIFNAIDGYEFKMPKSIAERIFQALEDRDRKLVENNHSFDSEFRKGFLLAQDIVKLEIKNTPPDLSDHSPSQQATPCTAESLREDANNFTQEEIDAAKRTKQRIIDSGTRELNAAYMAGEICMWDELRNKSSVPSTGQGVEKSAEEIAEELWDEFSQTVGDDIDAMQYFGGRSVITEEDFKKAITKLKAEGGGEDK